MTTRSKRLWQSRLSSGSPATLYVAPPQTVTLLKHVALQNWSGVAARLSLFLQDANGTVAIYLLDADLEQASSLEWSGWIVLEAGDQVALTFAEQPVDSWGSGTELPAGFPSGVV